MIVGAARIRPVAEQRTRERADEMAGREVDLGLGHLEIALDEPVQQALSEVRHVESGMVLLVAAERVARRIGQIQVGTGVERLRPATSTKIAVQVPRTIHAHLRSTITVEAELPRQLLERFQKEELDARS